MNDRRLRVSSRQDMDIALMGTGVPHVQDSSERYLNVCTKVVQATAGVRHSGSAALDLAYVAAGRLDGYWQEGLSPWDTAAGILLIQEAGGALYDFNKTNNILTSGSVIAANNLLHKELCQLVLG